MEWFWDHINCLLLLKSKTVIHQWMSIRVRFRVWTFGWSPNRTFDGRTQYETGYCWNYLLYMLPEQLGGGGSVQKSLRGCVANMGSKTNPSVYEWPLIKCKIWYVHRSIFHNFPKGPLIVSMKISPCTIEGTS